MTQNTDKKRNLFIMVPIELDEGDIDPFVFRIYARIVRRRGAGEIGCFESIDNMAKGCGINRNRVYACIKTLLNHNIIQKSTQPGRPSIYTPTDPSEWKITLPQLGKEELNPTNPTHDSSETYTDSGTPLYEIQDTPIRIPGHPYTDFGTSATTSSSETYTDSGTPLYENQDTPIRESGHKEYTFKEDPFKDQNKTREDQEKKDLINKKSNGTPTQKPSADNGASEGDVPPHKKPSADPGNGRESAGEGESEKKNQGAEGPENKNPETESPETGAGIEKDPEGELDDKPNSTARCEERFHAPWPKGDWGQADRRFLNSPEGVKLRQILNGAGIEPERWVDFLHYWAKESQFANWKGNEAWKQKTDIEKLTAIKNALKAQLKRPDRQDTIMGIVEGFKSRLRLAEATKRKREALLNPQTERRVWSKEEILAKYEAIKAEELQATAK